MNRLRAICESSSDIPEDDRVSGAEAPNKLMSFEEFVASHPDGVDLDSFDFDTLSAGCKAKLQAEHDEEQTKIDSTDFVYDFKKLSRDFEAAQAELSASGEERKKEKKVVVEMPADDIKQDEEKTKLERQLDRLQHFIDKHFISLNEARRLASLFGHRTVLREVRSGWSIEDAVAHKTQRNTIFSFFKQSLDPEVLSEKSVADFFKNRAC